MLKTTCMLLLFFITGAVVALSAESSREARGEALFRKHCIACHPKPGSMKGVNVVNRMRNPAAPMPTFDQDKISDADARAIADYIKQQIYFNVTM